MKWYAEIKDNFDACPGSVTFGPYGTRKEAQWAIDQEMKAAQELFTDGRANLESRIYPA